MRLDLPRILTGYRIPVRATAILLTVLLVVAQIGLFQGLGIDVQAAEAAAVNQWMSVVGTGINVRASAAVSSSDLDTLNNGHRVYAWTSQYNSTDRYTWYLVTYISGNVPRTGYIAGNFLSPLGSGPVSTTPGDSFEQDLAQFPASYWPGLRRLHALNSQWKFIAKNTGLDWEEVLDNESASFRSVIPMSNNTSLRSTDPVTYVASSNSWVDSLKQPIPSGGWVMANRSTLSYYLDPRNMLDTAHVFMFEQLSYNSAIHSSAGVRSILGTSFMGGTASFAYNGGQITYADAFMEAAKVSQVSPYHLAARARQEVTSGNLPSNSVTGTYFSTYRNQSYAGLYNFYNIGATDGGDPVANGLEWALLGSDRLANITESDTRYLIPWQDSSGVSGRFKAIVGGAKYIGAGYINAGQDTLYLQKFDVDSTANGLYWHQYMTFIGAPHGESEALSNSYQSSGIIGSPFSFVIPVYNNMPDEPVPLPAGNGNINNYLTGLSVKGTPVSPAFNRSTTSGYSVTVPNETTTLNLVSDFTATREDNRSVVTVDGPTELSVGNNAFTVTVQASYGNVPRVYSLNVIRAVQPDVTPPVLTLNFSLITTDDLGVTTTTPITRADLAGPATRGDILVTATVDEGGVLNAPSYTFVANGEFTFIATDAAGNVTSDKITVSRIDKEEPLAPTLTADPVSPTNGLVTVTPNFTVDVVLKQYKWSGDTTWSTYDESTPVTTILNHSTVTFRGQDAAGNWSTESSLKISNIDLIKPATPTVTAVPDSTTATAGPVTLTPSYSDDTAIRRYRIGSDGSWLVYTAPIELTANATVYFQGQDLAGNLSDISSIQIDTITLAPSPTPSPTPSPIPSPTPSPTPSPDPGTTPTPSPSPTPSPTPTPAPEEASAPVITLGTYPTTPTNEDVVVTASVDSGYLNTTSYRFVANSSFTFIATNSAGKQSTRTVTLTNIDKTAPSAPYLTVSTIVATPGPVSVVASFESNAAQKLYKIGAGDVWSSYTSAVFVAENATLSFKQQDAAGNWSTISSVLINNIDTLRPAAPTAVATPVLSTQGSVTVTPTYSTDSAIRQYKIGSTGIWTAYTKPIVLLANNTLYFKAQDLAGNWSDEGSIVIANIAAPTPTPTPTPTPIPTTATTTQPASGGGGGGGSGGGGGGGGEEPDTSVQSTVYKISGNTITGLNPASNSNTVSALSSKLSLPTGASLTVRTPGGKAVSASSRIGTGYQIQVVSGGSIQASYTAIVYGDTTGDGSINIMDVATLFKYIRNKQSLGTAYQLAGDTDRNSKVNITDVATAFKHVRNKTTIVQ